MTKTVTAAVRISYVEARRQRPDLAVAYLAPVIAELLASGVTSLRGIAVALNERGIPTVAGYGRWHHVQVGRLLARLGADRIPKSPNRVTLRALQASLKTRQARAADTLAKLAPIIAELRAAGVASQKGIAAALNKRGEPTPMGRGQWHQSQVARLLKRLPG
jgi:hypothetical protein